LPSQDYFPNRRTDPDSLLQYIAGRAIIARTDTTQSASVTLKMNTHSITAHPDGTMKFNGKDCTNVSHDQIVRAMIRCIGPYQPETPDFDADFDDKVPPTLWSISYFNQHVANGECEDEEEVESLMYSFLADATRQMTPYRISTPQNPITPPTTTGIDSILAKHILMPIFFPPVHAIGRYALVDLSHWPRGVVGTGLQRHDILEVPITKRMFIHDAFQRTIKIAETSRAA
jgi:hypothetical protein